MKIKDLYLTEDEISKKIATFDLNDFGKFEADLFKRYEEIKVAPTINRSEAELLIATDKELAEAILDYKLSNEPISNEYIRGMINIIKRITPVDKVFYRGTETEAYDDNHVMAIQSWSMNIKTAKMFGEYIWQTTRPVQGIEISQVAYLYDFLHDTYSMMGDSQAEWLLLPPNKELVD